MKNFQIEIVGNTYRIYLNQSLLGLIDYSEAEGGYLVNPSGVEYRGFFKNLEVAIIELIFHTYSKHTEIARC